MLTLSHLASVTVASTPTLPSAHAKPLVLASGSIRFRGLQPPDALLIASKISQFSHRTLPIIIRYYTPLVRNAFFTSTTRVLRVPMQIAICAGALWCLDSTRTRCCPSSFVPSFSQSWGLPQSSGVLVPTDVACPASSRFRFLSGVAPAFFRTDTFQNKKALESTADVRSSCGSPPEKPRIM